MVTLVPLVALQCWWPWCWWWPCSAGGPGAGGGQAQGRRRATRPRAELGSPGPPELLGGGAGTRGDQGGSEGCVSTRVCV